MHTHAILKTTKVWGSNRPVCRAYYIPPIRHNKYPKRTGRNRYRNNRRAPASPAADEPLWPDSYFCRRWVWIGWGAARV